MTPEEIEHQIKEMREDTYAQVMQGNYTTVRNLIDRVENLEYLRNTRHASQVHCLVCEYCGGTGAGQFDECQVCEGYGTIYK